ncbi:hypothetical protein D918_04334 [Trichuris suis]|nr:hypothetical protein D918_04334 [Trichuris suis]
MSMPGMYSVEILTERDTLYRYIQRRVRRNPSLFSMNSPVCAPTASEEERRLQNELCITFCLHMFVDMLRDCDVDICLQRYEDAQQQQRSNSSSLQTGTAPATNALMAEAARIVSESRNQMGNNSARSGRVKRRREGPHDDRLSKLRKQKSVAPVNGTSVIDVAERCPKTLANSECQSNEGTKVEDQNSKTDRQHGLNNCSNAGSQDTVRRRIRSPHTPDEPPPPPSDDDSERECVKSETAQQSLGSTDMSIETKPEDIENCGNELLQWMPARNHQNAHFPYSSSSKGRRPNGAHARQGPFINSSSTMHKQQQVVYTEQRFQTMVSNGVGMAAPNVTHPWYNTATTSFPYLYMCPHQQDAYYMSSYSMPIYQYQYTTSHGVNGNQPTPINYPVSAPSVLNMHTVPLPTPMAAPAYAAQPMPPTGGNVGQAYSKTRNA